MATLVHSWALSDTADGTGSMTLTNNNSVSFVTGKVGNAADFGTNNTNKSLTETSTNIVTYAQFASGWSLNCWVNLHNYNQTRDNFWWIRVTDGTYCRQGGLSYVGSGTKHFGMYFFPNSGGGQGTWEPNYTLNLDTWYMVTMTYDGTNFRLYINGDSTPLDTYNFASWGSYSLNSKIWTIGVQGTAYSNSLIDEIKVYTGALSTSDIATLYNVGSASPSISPSQSPSVSISPSVSTSASPSAPALITGSAVWGHSTGATETNKRTFSTNWSGTGDITGTGDTERLELNSGEYMAGEVVNTGVTQITLLQNTYRSGDTVTIKYRHGDSEANCLAASYNTYTVPFTSLGYVQVRVESTL